VLKPIVVKAYKLPSYSRKTRNFQDQRVLILRDELLSTQNPYELLYKKIPDLDNIHLLNPTTFMNDSGLSVAKILNFYKIKPEEILVIHDELDLLPGDIRLKNGGGHGGHNGLKSIISSIGTNTFWRLRIGIGHPGNKNLVKAYVLKRPLKNEEEEIRSAILRGYQNLSYMINGSFEKAMLNLHTKE